MTPPPAPPPGLAPEDLAAVALFADLDADQHHRLLENHRLLTLEADQRLVLEQDESQGLFLLRSGLAKVRGFDLDGQETVLALLGAGEICGEMAILNPEGLRTADVVSLTPMRVAVLRAGPFAALLRSDTRLALALARLQARRLQNLNHRLRLRGGDATIRLLATLVELARRSAPGACETDPIPPLPQREIASLSGLARETASRTLSSLRRRGLVADTPEGGLQLLNREDLRRRGLVA
ncbi:MAG: Crp/Fnr family transcriptional regulator [Synechococcaceae cyanobacterium]|nr:Crp/Fnr family transcriptional regulator [Synechococcaceae cyanobacterium]